MAKMVIRRADGCQECAPSGSVALDVGLLLDLAHHAVDLQSPQTGLQVLQHRRRFVVAMSQHEPARTFHRADHAAERNDRRHHAQHQHGPPVAAVGQQQPGQVGNQDSHGNHQLECRDDRTPPLRRCEFGQEHRRRQRRCADRHAQHQPATVSTTTPGATRRQPSQRRTTRSMPATPAAGQTGRTIPPQ